MPSPASCLRLAGVLGALFLLAGCDQPPVIEGITVDPNPVEQNGMCLLTATVTSPTGEGMTFHWTDVDAGGELQQTTGNPVNWKAPKLTGSYRVALRVLDAHVRADEDTVTIQVQ